MTLPTFLGIGVPKAGSTWLYALLEGHPQVFMPTKIKDVRYFDVHYDMGLNWYQQFFPDADEAGNYKAIGEYTAAYLYSEDCPQRMAQDLNDPKLLLMLRNPVDRTFSQYNHAARYRNYQGSFEDFLVDRPKITEGSFYSRYIKRYQAYFGPEQLLILLFDRVFKNVEGTRSTVAEFLGIDPNLFAEDAGKRVVNKSFLPRYRGFYALIAKGAHVIQQRRIYWPVHMAKKLGIKQMLSVEGGKSEPMKPATRQQLQAKFSEEISALETILDTDLSSWRS